MREWGRTFAQGGGVGADVDGERQSAAGVEAPDRRVQRQLSDGDPHPVRACNDTSWEGEGTEGEQTIRQQQKTASMRKSRELRQKPTG